jgi:hypothetical protein
MIRINNLLKNCRVKNSFDWIKDSLGKSRYGLKNIITDYDKFTFFSSMK